MNADSSASGITSQITTAARKLLVKISEMTRMSRPPSARLCSTVCMRLIDQFRAVVDGDKLHARRENVLGGIVQLGDLFLDAFDDLEGVGSLAIEDDRLDDVVRPRGLDDIPVASFFSRSYQPTMPCRGAMPVRTSATSRT